MSFRAAHDLTGTVARLFIHPVKSCAGIEVQQALLTDTGLDLDRAWMVVDAQGVFLSQRTLPRMALIRPQLRSDDLVLHPACWCCMWRWTGWSSRPPCRCGTTPCPPGTWATWPRSGFRTFWGCAAGWCGLTGAPPAVRLRWTGGIEAPRPRFRTAFRAAGQPGVAGRPQRAAAGRGRGGGGHGALSAQPGDCRGRGARRRPRRRAVHRRRAKARCGCSSSSRAHAAHTPT